MQNNCTVFKDTIVLVHYLMLATDPVVPITNVTRQAMYVKVTPRSVRANTLLWKSNECYRFLALIIQLAKRKRRSISSSMTCLAVTYSSILPHKRHDLQDKIAGREMCVSIFCTPFV